MDSDPESDTSTVVEDDNDSSSESSNESGFRYEYGTFDTELQRRTPSPRHFDFDPRTFEPRQTIHFELRTYDPDNHWKDLIIAELGYFSPNILRVIPRFYIARLESLYFRNEETLDDEYRVYMRFSLTVFATFDTSEIVAIHFDHTIPDSFHHYYILSPLSET